MIEKFYEEIRQVTGGAPDLGKIVPGKWIAFPIGDKRGDTKGRCKLFLDGEGGIYGRWDDIKWHVWQARQPRTEEERAAFQDRVKQAREEATKIEAEQRAECRKKSTELWEKGSDVDVKHPYIMTKQIKPYVARQLKKSLIIPVRDTAGTLHGLQFIAADGSKKFKRGTMVASCYCGIGRPEGKLLIAEGWATACNLHEITGYAVAVAFNAGNLTHVARTLRAKLPDTTLVICADDDHATQENPGLTKATEAARAVNGLLAIPSFPETRGPKDTDFNDMARLTALEDVKACIEAAAPVTSSPSTTTETSSEKSSLFISIEEMFAAPINPIYCVDGVIEQNTLGELVGESGGGKTFVALDMSVAVATGGTTLNGRRAKKGLVLYLIGEGYTGSPRRIRALLEHQNIMMTDLSGIYFSRQTINIEAPDVRAVITEGKQLVEKHKTPLGLVVVDTLARHLVGDENSATDVGMFISELDSLKAAFPGCVVLIVHHTGHALESKSRGRGSSAIRAALDFEILCNQGTLIFTKMKDFDAPDPIEFKLKPVQVGVDDNGKSITSCIVEYGEKSHKRQQVSLSGLEHQALDALVTVCIAEMNMENEQYAGSLEAWRQEFYRMRRLEDDEVKQSALKVAFQRVTGTGPQGGGLKDKGIVAFTERGAIPLHLTEQDRIFKAVQTGGTRNIDGTITEHVPVSVAEHGTHTYKVCSDVPSDCPVPEVQVFTHEDFEGVTI